MRQTMRSFIMVAAAVLPVLAGGAAAHAAPPRAAAEPPADAPDCLEVGPGWRYTFVTSHCSGTYTVTVAYSDGRDVPCRVAGPGDRLTFPGYGSQGARVLGAVLCPGGPASSGPGEPAAQPNAAANVPGS